MADNAKTAADVLAAVGGKENVTNLIHCITRLRFSLKDESIPDADAIKKIPGVIGAQWSGGQFQVIIGQNVTKVYEEVMKLGVSGGGSIDIDEGDAKKFEWTPKNVGNAIMNYLSKSMVALIPIFMAAAMFKTIQAIVGPSMLNIADDASDLSILLNALYNAGFYFLPIYLGYSCAKALNASPVLGMFVGGIFLEPALTALASEGTTIAVFGIPAPAIAYGSSVLPIILSVWVMSIVERFFKKIVPDVLSTVFTPFLTVLVMVPLQLCVLGPIGNWGGQLLGNTLFSFGDMGGIIAIIASGIIGGAWEFLVMTGMHQVLITLALGAIAMTGYDSYVICAAIAANGASYGMALGAALRLRNKEEKSLAFGYFISALVGGVTEPVLYGVGMRYKR
ncbi:MAG: PTS transporter subunit EIIC, partial [Atopobiaceae bacterium]|nr:PTS transporter subunit EIIC [Atopobiaceae bacterium]